MVESSRRGLHKTAPFLPSRSRAGRPGGDPTAQALDASGRADEGPARNNMNDRFLTVKAREIVKWSTLLQEPRNEIRPDMKTFSAKPSDITRDWYVVDATDQVLGRLASQIALRLRGKHKPIYTPHMDTGDFIVVTNVEKLRVTGNKADDKLYHRHSGYPGGISTTSFAKMQARFPGRALEKAVRGMLPKGPLGYAMLKKLEVLRRRGASAFGAAAEDRSTRSDNQPATTPTKTNQNGHP